MGLIPPVLRVLGRAQRGIETIFIWIAAGCTAILMFLTVADFTGRYAASQPIAGATEVAEHLMIGLVFLGLAYTQLMKANIKVDAATRLLPPSIQNPLQVLMLFAGAWLFTMVTWRTGIWMWESWRISEYEWGLLSFPVYPAKTALTVGSGFLAFRYLVDAVTRLLEVARGSKKEVEGS